MVACLAVFEAFEIAVFLRWRRRRSTTGAESMEGLTGTVVTDCDPIGQVKLRGQIWRALCPERAVAGEQVTVTDVDGITLRVARSA